MLQALAPWLKVVAGLAVAVAVVSIRPVELFLLAVGVFALAYFGLPEFNDFVDQNPGLISTVATTALLAMVGFRLGPIGITLSIVAVGVGAFIAVRQFPVHLL